MTQQLVFGSILSAALAATLGAQAAGESTQQSASKSPGKDTVTLVGCLQAERSVATSRGGAVGSETSGKSTRSTSPSPAASAADQYILADATTGASTSGATGSSPTDATSGASGSAGAAGQNAYVLIGGNAQNLNEHLNHRIEVRGTLVATTSGSGMGDAAAETRSLPRLRVTSVRPVTGDTRPCSAGGR